VRNVTDIDDKIIKRALDNGETIRSLTDRMVAALHQDADALGIERPTHEPRATDYVPQMLSLIGTLEQKGLAYRAGNGDDNYAVRKFPGFGKLSGKSVDELRAGERVAVLDGKDDPLDFVLWKSAKPTEPAEAKWDSAYGPGRPGWHIECSAMSCEMLGESFDIHGGGADLRLHHENDRPEQERHRQPLAQSDAQRLRARGQREDVQVAGQLLHHPRILAQYDPETVRFFIIRAHYRSPLTTATRTWTMRAAPSSAFTRPCTRSSPRPCRSTGSTPMRRASRPPWTRTSARPRRWPCCSSWRPRSTRRARRNWPACSRPWAAAWACCKTIRKPS
jgi:cysteinyl-tRNA synthetase